MHYLSFRPSALPPDPPVAYDLDLLNSLVRANRAVASLEVASTKLPDVPLFLSMYVRKEALLSSQIEGTQATLDDILDPKTIENADIHVTEVLNYIRAVTFAENRLRELPVCNRLLAQTHRVLMSDIRGGDKSPGEFRRSQNWIGAPGSTLNKARYVPPNVADMQEAMTALEVYINTRDNTDPLVKAARFTISSRPFILFWTATEELVVYLCTCF
jgi:Fic family protein